MKKLNGAVPWYIAVLTTLAAIAREFLSKEPSCAVRSIEDLEKIIRKC